MTVLGGHKFGFHGNSVLVTTGTMIDISTYETKHGGANSQEERNKWLKIEMIPLFKTKFSSTMP